MNRFCVTALAVSILLCNLAAADETRQKSGGPAADRSIVRFYGEAACQNLPGADFKPGHLRLPLTVHERSGVERRGTLVSSGVPFPPGFLTDVDKLRVVDKDGKAVLSQATTMVKWWKPAYDDSVQWALVSFAADAPANGTATYFLTDDGKASAVASPLKIDRDEKAITIRTGPATFVVPLAGEALIAKASLGETEVIGGTGFRGVITAGDWPERNLAAGMKHVATHDAAGVTVEESGPARVVVCIKGAHTPGDKDRKFYDFTARLYFTFASPSVRVVYTIRNGRLDPTLVPGPDGKGQNRFAYIWPIKDASLLADLGPEEKANATSLADGKPVRDVVSDESMVAFQSALDGYRLTRGGKELAAGVRHLGVLGVDKGNQGVIVARRYFQEEWPGVLAASAKELRIGLFPAEADESFHLNSGQRKSWDLRLTLHGAAAPDLQACFAEQDALLLFRADPAWMVRAGGLAGAWSAGLALGGAPAKPPAMRREPARAGQIPKGGWGGPGGWDGFGVISSWNAGGTHWNEITAFARWVIDGNGASFDNAEIPTLWASDHCPIQYDHPDQTAFFPLLGYGSTEHCRLKVLTYPGYRNRVAWGRPDTGHMGMWMWVEYYLLTGDARCREAICHLGDMARGFLWKFSHDDKKDGTGPLPGNQFRDFRKHDPDAEPDFKLDTRYYGWPLYCLAQYYQFTGEPAMLEEARIAARAFRNTARACPIGQLVKDAAGKNGTEGTEYSNTFGFPNGNGGVVSQVREWPRSASLVASNFYSGIIIFGLREYYLVSRDIEILDTLVGQIDRFCHYSLIRDPKDKPAGWSYIFADYWGPYTWEDAQDPKTGRFMGFTSSNELTSDAIARIYPLAGRADLLDVLQAAAVPNARSNRTLSLLMATGHVRVDQTPPAEIKDLAAEVLGGGKVKLTWTAPGGDGDKGRAAWYQVKWSPARIVELTKGWPDRAEPLPATRKEWLERAAAFNARQRAFWAAFNVGGAPVPATAGTTESMTVEGIPVGTASFAIKSWDAASNVSGLSNVIDAVVK